MPLSDVHKRKFKKNLAVLGLITGFFVLVWAVTMIKIANNAAPPAAAETSLPESANPVE
jgi:hypothetical protein